MSELERLGPHLPRLQSQTRQTVDTTAEALDSAVVVVAPRPTDCWCLGRGGQELRFIPDGDGGGIPVFAQCCTCPEGQAEQARKELETEAYHTRQRIARAKKYFELARVPERFAHCSFRNYPESEATAQAVELVGKWAHDGPTEPGRNSLFLYGSPGVGKTGLAVAAMRAVVVTRKQAALFVATPDLLDKIRASYGGNSDGSAAELFDAVKGIDLLVMDDLGAERPTAWVQEKLFALINHRHDHCLPTIFTSNLDPASLDAHLGARTAPRIREMSLAIHIDGPDLRRQTARLPYADD